jgi:hypothetical protein
VESEWRGSGEGVARGGNVLILGAAAVVVVEIEADARREVAGGKRRWQRESNGGLRGPVLEYLGCLEFPSL